MPIPPPHVPDHELIRHIGRGGYGSVWLARSLTGTYRAIKIISRVTFSNDRPYEREFLGIQKFEPLSRTHPGLISILHVGRLPDAQCFYYVMEIADDLLAGPRIDPNQYRPKTLASLLAQSAALPLNDCLRIGLALLAALAHLHKHGLIHRDIKPANIVFVLDQPKLADIGLVTHINEHTTFVGTEGYLPPEGPGSPVADLFALGKVLYQIAMGHDCTQFPKLPANIRSRPEAQTLLQLNQILLKACDPNPRHRFPSADAMRAALLPLLPLTAIATPSTLPLAPTSIQSPASPPLITVLHSPHSASDTLLAHALEQALVCQGFSVSLDAPTQLNLDWGRAIEAQIRSSSLLVPLLSSETLLLPHIAYALEIASQTTRASSSDRPFRILPVQIHPPLSWPPQVQIMLGSEPPFSWQNPQDTPRLLEKILKYFERSEPPGRNPGHET